MSASDSDRNEAQGHSSAGASTDHVVRTVERRILLDALRQVESINTDDDNWRIEPLPQGRIAGVFDELEDILAAEPVVVPDCPDDTTSSNADCC